ncbi:MULTISPECIES: anhydro-N-acetylmuramic acid kinase [Paenibacillus]|uniref:Anhydro-N-acetylmuramic acid kinase n=1 Tax=Paenibacillus albilobatus TaxID=2716884 RepID=A0A919XIQ2_9BACL|nr:MULTISPECIES: anhydro-N-acetylmuramic acid kinase [Paenibacillus]GIO31038.1 anhydro-N-acetylmuramic acid kinase [Paenibacillus albilobatus]
MKRETLDLHASRYAVGLMSGTSVDGIDAALVQISDASDEGVSVRLIAFENTPYPAAVRQEIFDLFDPTKATIDKVGCMNVLLGELSAEAALAVIKAAGLKPADVAVVGSHGQTIYHAPEPEKRHGYDIRYTVQIGEGSVIAARTGIPCVTDFRPADMAVGGQGAPLVPFTEYLLYREANRTLLLQNIGGIGNMTVIPAGCPPEQVYAFDTGPGNMIIDGVVERLYPGQTMDAGGAIAGRGTVDEELLELLTKEPYYSQPLPKSTGREMFGSVYIDRVLDIAKRKGMKAEDVVATVTMLTAWSIGDAYRRYVRDRAPADVLIVGGGGSYNPVLVGFLRRVMEPMGVQVMTQEAIGHSSDAKEAVAFALLADYAMNRQPNNLPNVTGAARPVIMGKISY